MISRVTPLTVPRTYLPPRLLMSTSTASSSTTTATPAAKPIRHKSFLTSHQIYHFSSIGLAALIPVGVLLAPSAISHYIDYGLGVLIPIHMHIGNAFLDTKYALTNSIIRNECSRE
jgi:hypothetical protein